MITGSILLALAAAVFLVLGLAADSNPDGYYYSSIVGSVLAGFALFAGLRHRPGAQLPEDDFDGPTGSDRARAARPESGRSAGLAPGRATGRASVAGSGAAGPDESQASAGWEEGAAVAAGWLDDDAPPAAGLPDEPPEQQLTVAAAARVARLGTQVMVIDGRPRYHLPECLHLLGRTTQRLPVTEAVELGFTPCGDCEPATTLLATVRA